MKEKECIETGSASTSTSCALVSELDATHLEKPNRAPSKNSSLKCAQRELLLLSTQNCASIYETMCIGEAGRSRPLQIAQFIIENKCYYPELSVYI